MLNDNNMNNVEFLVVKERSSFRTIWDAILVTMTGIITFIITMIVIFLIALKIFKDNLNSNQKQANNIINVVRLFIISFFN